MSKLVIKIFLVVTLASGLVQLQPEAAVCPSDWRWFGGKCYKIYSQDLETQDTNYDGASTYCRSKSSQLASIKNQNEQDFLTTYLGEPNAKSKVWIGLKKDGNEQLKWEDGTNFSYKNFGPGQPNGGLTERCIHMQGSEVIAGKWNDDSCSNHRGFICEKESSGALENWTYGHDRRCPNGFQHYRDNCYRLFSEVLDWESAERKCQSDFDGHLISILDLYDEAFLAVMAGNLTDEIWIGFSDTNDMMEGSFSWSDGSPIYHLNWDNGKPNETQPNTRCVARRSNKVWTVTDCSKKLKFVCSRRLVKPDPEVVFGDCSINWIDVGNNYCYFIQRVEKISFDEAEERCKSMGKNGSLAKFGSAHELNLLRRYVDEMFYDMLYVGIKARNSNGVFSFVGGCEEASYLPWDKGEPNSLNTEWCVALYPKFMKYYNLACSSRLYFICQEDKVVRKRLRSEHLQIKLPHRNTQKETTTRSTALIVVGVFSVFLVIFGGTLWFYKRISPEGSTSPRISFVNDDDE